MILYFLNHLKLFLLCFFFFNDTATTEIYTLSLHDALPISDNKLCKKLGVAARKEAEEYSWEKAAKQILRFAKYK